jgi:hypothetical protein
MLSIPGEIAMFPEYLNYGSNFMIYTVNAGEWLYGRE